MLATGALLAAGFSATDAQAVDVEMYGQVNKGVLHVDAGDNGSETSIVDNDGSSTRFGVKGEQMLDNGLTASVLLEFQSESNSSASVDGNDNDTDAKEGTAFTEREARVGLAGNFGAILLGKTSGVTQGIAEIDLAGAADVMNSDITDYAGAVTLDTGVTFAQASNNFDGSRHNAVVYMTPVVNGFQAGVHMTEVGNVAGALRYSGKIDAYQIKAGIAYETVEEADSVSTAEDRTVGSVSVKHDSGLAATFAYGVQSDDAANRDDATNTYVKVGYTMDALELAADYTLSEDVAQNGDELTSYGLAAQYNLGKGVSVAGLYRTVELDRDGSTTEEDVDMFMANLRVKF